MRFEDIEIISRIGNPLWRLNHFVTLCMGGLHSGTQASIYPQLSREINELLKKPDPYPSEEKFQTELDECRKLEEIAKDEVDEGFPYLLSLASVSLWSILESGVDDLCSFAIETEDRCKNTEAVSKIRAPVVEFMSASNSEQAEYIVGALKQSIDANFKLGVSRFDSLLKCVGIVHETINDDIRKIFLELSQIRNVIMHKAGTVDKKLVTRCPWLSFNIGDKLKIDHRRFMIYHYAAYWYVLDIDNSCNDFVSHARNERVIEVQNTLLKAISRLEQGDIS